MTGSKAKGSTSKQILLADDEPEYLEWVEDYLESKGFSVVRATDVESALDALKTNEFRLVIADMNIPASDATLESWASRWPLVRRYHGIALILSARNKQYGAHSVIGYTVHDDPELGEVLARVSARYVLKGRPAIFKGVIEKSLAPAPLPVR